jgi:hypothetical protein
VVGSGIQQITRVWFRPEGLPSGAGDMYPG